MIRGNENTENQHLVTEEFTYRGKKYKFEALIYFIESIDGRIHASTVTREVKEMKKEEREE